MFRLPLFLLGLLLATSAFCVQTVNIGVLSFKSIEETQKKWEPTAKWLTSQINGYDFHIQAMNVIDMDKMVNAGKLDFVLTNPEHLAHLHFEHEFTPIATLMTEINGLAVNKFGGVIFTRSDQEDIVHLDDLKGKRVAAVDKKSFGGYMMQAWALYSAGVEIKNGVSFVGFPHDQVVTNVINGISDVGFVRTGVLESMYKNKSLDPSKIKIINPQSQLHFPQAISTQLYPEWAFATSSKNNQMLIKEVASALLDILPKTECAVIGGYYGFTPPADYQDVEALMVKLGELPMSREFGLKDVLVKYSTLAILLLLFLLLAGVPIFVKLYTGNAELKAALAKIDILGLRDNLLESLHDGVIGMNKQYECNFINHAALQMLGFTKEEVLGKDVYKLIFNDNEENKYSKTTSSSFNNELLEHYLFRKDGTHFEASLSLVPIVDSEEDIVGTVILFHDITKQKETEALMQASEQEIRKLAMVAENTDNGVIITNVNREIEWVNNAFTKISGYTLAEVIGKKPSKFLQGKKTDLNTVLYMRHRLNSGEGFTLENINYRKNNEEYLVEFSVKPIRDASGRLTGFFGMQNDITHKRKVEDELSIALKEAQSANIAKSEFLANMSHEIRTPLNGIMGFTTLLKRSSYMMQKDKEHLWLIDKSSKNLLDIINDILDFSKVEANKLELNPHSHNPKADYAQIATLFTPQAIEKNIKFLTFIDPNIPRLIIADSMRIRQILNNLISNAIKFTPQNGCVTLRVEGNGCKDGRCTINYTVTDTGIGIDEKTIAKLFSPFSQADMTTSKEYGGTGLGLAISKSLAALMDSQINVTSAIDKGSEFSFGIEVETHEPSRLVIPQTLRLAILTVSFCEEIGLFLEYAQAFGLGISILDRLDEDDGSYDVVVVHIDELTDFHIPFGIMANKLIVISHYHDKVAPFTNMLSTPLVPLKIHEAICRIANVYTEREQLSETGTALTFGARALVVDDNDVNRMLLTEILQGYDITSIEAEDGCEAFELFKSMKFDIVLMDIHMPKCDGIVGLTKIREFECEYDLQATPVIALTADAIIGKKEILLSQGFDAYITKPIDLSELEGVLKRLLQTTQAEEYVENAETVEEDVSSLENEYFSASQTARELGISQAGVIRSFMAFLRSLNETIAAMRTSLEQKDAQAIKDQAHKIKGASANLRITAIAEPAKFIEESAMKGDFEILRTKMEEIERIVKLLPQA
jgi:PAS domain S-box-containing protein